MNRKTIDLSRTKSAPRSRACNNAGSVRPPSPSEPIRKKSRRPNRAERRQRFNMTKLPGGTEGGRRAGGIDLILCDLPHHRNLVPIARSVSEGAAISHPRLRFGLMRRHDPFAADELHDRGKAGVIAAFADF